MRTTAIAFTAAALVFAGTPPVQAAPRPGTTIRVTPTVDAAGNKVSIPSAEISGDGGTVAFATSAALVPEDTNALLDVYVTDVDEGGLERVSLTTDGQQPNGSCQFAQLSDDGRFVAFQCLATNMAPGDANDSWDVFVRDRAADTTLLASAAADGKIADGGSLYPSISSDGRFVCFINFGSNLVAGDGNMYADVFVKDLQTGAVQMASLTSDGRQGVTNVLDAEISGNGRYVAFIGRFPYTTNDQSASDDVFVRDLVAGTTDLVTVASDGSSPFANVGYPSIDDSGRFVTFGSFAQNLVPNDTNGYFDSFVHDRQTGMTERLIAPDGAQPNGVWGVAVISGNGRYISGNVVPSNLGWPDDNGVADTYVYDRITRSVELLSVTPDGQAGDGHSISPSFSDDGRRVAFVSQATDLLGDTAGPGHGYVRDRGPELGVARLHAAMNGDTVSVGGSARWTGGPIATFQDSPADGEAGAHPAGLEVTGGEVVHRPEESELQFRIDLKPRRHFWPPLVGTSYQKPDVSAYGFEYVLDGVRHQLRATSQANLDGPRFELYRCAGPCMKIADVRGGVGTIGEAVLITTPLETLGLAPGSKLELVRAWSALGGGPTGELRVMDEASLETASIPHASVSLALGSASRPEDSAFERVPAVDGRFEALLAATGQRVWVEVCLGQECRYTSKAVA